MKKRKRFNLLRRIHNFRSRMKRDMSKTMVDLEGKPLKKGNIVSASRYNLGACELKRHFSLFKKDRYYYKSLTTGRQVSWKAMIHGSGSRLCQKVTFLLPK